MIINGEEIKQLAEYAGFKVELVSDEDKEITLEAEYSLRSNIELFDEETGKTYKHPIAVQCDGCEHHEWNPLSDGEEKDILFHGDEKQAAFKGDIYDPENFNDKAIDVLTENIHARRTVINDVIVLNKLKDNK